MARRDFGYLPKQNPCAQCGKPIAKPEWIENGPRRISYLWHCTACDYRFEAGAVFAASDSASANIAALLSRLAGPTPAFLGTRETHAVHLPHTLPGGARVVAA